MATINAENLLDWFSYYDNIHGNDANWQDLKSQLGLSEETIKNAGLFERDKLVDSFNKAITLQDDKIRNLIGAETEKQNKLQQQRAARESGISENEAAAKNAYTQARNQGLGRGLAASIGDAPLSQYTAQNYSSNYNNLANLKQSTQNDYLKKQGYANQLDQQADNLEKGNFFTNMAAGLTGAGTGAQIGNSLFGGLGK